MSTTFHSTDWSYYDVSGATIADAAAAIAHLPEAGSAEWHPEYHYQANEHGVITEVTVTVGTTVTLPNWTGYSSASSAEQAEWTRFIHALTAHEQGHLQLAVDHLTDIDQRMTGVSPDAAAHTWTSALGDLQRASDSYDSQNDHGRSAGTIIDLDVVPVHTEPYEPTEI